MTQRAPVRGPGSNQHADKPPLPPRAVFGQSSQVWSDDSIENLHADRPAKPYVVPDFIEDDPAVVNDQGQLVTPKGREAQPLPGDLVAPERCKPVAVGPFQFTKHLEERRSEMGVSRLRIMHALKAVDEKRVQYRNGEAQIEVKSGPYTLYLSEDCQRVITLVWRTKERKWQRGWGVPADCAEMHLATRVGIPGAPGTDVSLKKLKGGA